MKTSLITIFMVILGFAVPGSASVVDLSNIVFDVSYKALTVTEVEKTGGKDGKPALRVESPHSALVCIGEKSGLKIENETIWFQVQMKVSGVIRGGAYLEMWCEAKDGNRFFSRGLDQVMKGDSDWKEVKIPMRVQKGFEVQRVIMNVVLEGPGKIWISGAKLFSEPNP